MSAGTPAATLEFAAVAQAALGRAEQLVGQWLRGGALRGDEYAAARTSKGGPGDSLTVNVKTGRWGHFAAGAAGGDLVSLYAYVFEVSQGRALRELAEQLGLQGAPSSAPPRAPAAPGTHTEAPAPKRARSEWQPVVPVPESAPPVRAQHYHYGAPSTVWAYRRDGVLYGHVARYDRSTPGEKEVLPITWCCNADGEHKWHFKGWNEPRPLYLPLGTAGRPEQLVVIVEGEKKADTLQQLLGDEFVVASWPGGCRAERYADWAWLAGRKCILWPDCDSQRAPLSRADKQAGADAQAQPYLPAEQQPGMVAMRRIAQRLVALGGRAWMCCIDAPGVKPPGWDAHDAIATDGWTRERVVEFLRAAQPCKGDDAAEGATPQRPAAAGRGARRLSAVECAALGMILSSNGAAKPCRENVLVALQSPQLLPELSGLVRMDQFAQQVSKVRAAPWDAAGATVPAEWTPDDDLQLARYLAWRCGLLLASAQPVMEAVQLAALDAAYHPVREWIESTRWDGVPRLEGWMARALKVEQTEYLSRVGLYWLVAMVMRVYAPGSQWRYCVIFEGAQNIGKSKIGKTLAWPWFADTPLDLSNKDVYQNIQAVWLYEIAELDAFNRSDTRKVKAFISSGTDRFRSAYERRPRTVSRQVTFYATTNEHEYLRDYTGSTRFWPVDVPHAPDFVWLNEMRGQLFAEARALYSDGLEPWPDAAEAERLFRPEQERREVGNPYLAVIAGYLTEAVDQQTVTLEKLWMNAIKADLPKLTDLERTKMGAAMARLGWLRERQGSGARQWYYRRPVGWRAWVEDDARGAASASGQSSGAPEDGDVPF